MALTRLPNFTLLNTDSFTFGNANVTGNVTVGNILTDHLLYANGAAWTFGGSYTNSNVSSYLATFTGNIAANNVTTTGNVTAAYLIGDGSQLTGLPASYTNTNVSSYLGTFTGNISANIITASGNISSAANVTAQYLIGNGSQLTGTVPTANYAAYAGNITIAAQPNITSVGTLVNTVLAGPNSLTGGNLVSANYFTGTLTTAVQPNITSIGTLASLAVTGNISSAANVTAQYLIGNGSQLTGTIANANYAAYAGNVINATQSNITSIGTLTSLSVTNDVIIGGNLTISGSTTTVNSTTVNINDINIVLANNASTAAQANGAGITINGAAANIIYNSTSNAFVFSHPISADGALLSNVPYGNIVGLGNIVTINKDGNSSNVLYGNGVFASAPVTYANSNVAAYLPTYTGNITGNIVTLTGNVSAINANLGNLVTANYLIGTLTTEVQPNITSVGTLTSLNVSGNVTSANILTDHLLYANGTAWNFGSTYSNSNVQSYLPTYTGDLSPGNLTVGTSANLGSNANVTITGGTTGQVLTTNGSGALSWSTPSASGGSIPTIAVDTFTGDGTTTTFTLSISPSSVNNVFISYNGAFVNRSSYSVSGTTLTFGSAPANGSKIEVSTLSSIVTSLSDLGTGPASFATTTYTGDGTTVNYTIGTNQTVSSIIATLDGVVQTPTTDYTVSGTTLTFTSAPYNGATIQLRELGVAIASSGSGGGASRAQAMVMGIVFGG